MKNKIPVLLSLFLFSHFILSAQKNFIQYVDPFIGTGGHGHTYPGATLPHGMVQLSPDTRLDGWDGCGGYHYSDNYIYGFTHTHLSGTGVSDYGDILLMPMRGEPSFDNKKYGSKFSHENEKATAGFYSVKLDDDNILAELTATTRVGFHRYKFPEANNNFIILDLKHRDEVTESSLKIINLYTIAGMRRSKAWANNQYVYFVIEFSKPFINKGFWKDDQLLPAGENDIKNAKNLKAFFEFENNIVMAKVGISSVSIEGARKNLDAEIPAWNFDKVKQDAANIWNTELSRIAVESSDIKQLRTFYTALYHTAIVPNINQDVDGQYRGRDNKIHQATGFTNYSVFSLWDTYRGAHPLYTIIDRKRTLDYIQTFLVQYQQGGRLPVWELSSNETDCMIGYHSVPVIVDAYMKGIDQFDTKLALEAMKRSATWDHLGLPALMDHGLLEMDDEHESVSKTLEYAYDDWCITQFAKKLDSLSPDYTNYIKRAQSYKNMLDPVTGFMRPRKNGNWVSPFDPREVNNNFTEANSWQYSFYTPQDINGYIGMIGGKKKMEQKLDKLFTENSKTTGRDQSDITGLIGQYAHGNEPSHHIAYLYNFTGAAFKTQAMVHRIMNTMYHDTPDGLEGNEDCGQMSAWYVLSALGFYPVTPGTTDYIIGTPLFSSATINLENGKTFTLRGNVSDSNYYIQATALNKKPYSRSYLSYFDIENGGNFDFTLGSKPAAFGSIDMPSTGITDNKIVLNPVIDGGAISFREPKLVKIGSAQKGLLYYYTTDGNTPTKLSKKYLTPIPVKGSITIKAIAVNAKGETSYITTASYKKMPNNWTIKLNTAYEQQYDGGGANGLIDGIRGEADWRKGNWQGYQKTDMDVVIDLLKPTTVFTVNIGLLQDTRAWIVLPKRIIVEVSEDNKVFKEVYTGENFLPIEELTAQVKNVEASFTPVATRYIRVKAIQFGKLPAWHEGAGGDTHIFVDEIMVK
jgi:predicted alpha-1,2-mannosidase